MVASNSPIGAKLSFLVFFSTLGALVTPSCFLMLDEPVSPGDDAESGAWGTETAHPSTEISGSGGSEAMGGAAAGVGGARGPGGSEAGGSSAGGSETAPFSAIAAGYYSTYAIRDSAGYYWGNNGPQPEAGLASGVTAIAVASQQWCAIVNGGAVCWGNFFGNWYNKDDHEAPAPVEGLTSGVTAISTNIAYYDLENVCAIVSGDVMCWGFSYDAFIVSGPWSIVKVQGLPSGATAIAAAGHHACAVVDGGAWCWGSDEWGQLGSGTTDGESTVPVQVQGLTSGVTAIGVGGWDSCAIVNGGVWCWGSNARVDPESGTATDSSVPVQVQGLASGVTALSVGYSHKCAVVNGGAKCWGMNDRGQLGGGTETYIPVPVQVQGLTSGVTAVAAGFDHSAAIVNGGVKRWGNI